MGNTDGTFCLAFMAFKSCISMTNSSSASSALPSAARAKVSDTITEEDGNDQVTEVAAIAWSYAALTYLQLDPAIVFHPQGYLGKSESLLFGFQLGLYPGAPLLEAAEMTALGERARQLGVPPYPHMLKWLRD